MMKVRIDTMRSKYIAAKYMRNFLALTHWYIRWQKLNKTENMITAHTVPVAYIMVKIKARNGFRINPSIMNTACHDNISIAVNTTHKAKL